MAHVPRLTRQLQQLLAGQRVAALGTLGDDGAPLVSMVPFAVHRGLGAIVIHVSDLAAHSRNLQARPRVSLLVMQPEVAGEPVHALPRVTIDGHARLPGPGGDEWRACGQAYVERFPEAAFMTELGDFRFVAIEPAGARQVAGFGAARSIDAAEVRLALQAPG